MASLIPSILSQDPHTQIFIVGATIVLLIGIVFATTLQSSKDGKEDENPSTFTSFLRFFYASFLKPHDGDGTGNVSTLVPRLLFGGLRGYIPQEFLDIDMLNTRSFL